MGPLIPDIPWSQCALARTARNNLGFPSSKGPPLLLIVSGYVLTYKCLRFQVSKPVQLLSVGAQEQAAFSCAAETVRTARVALENASYLCNS